MANTTSDFVLDDDLDEDEDILNYQSQQQRPEDERRMEEAEKGAREREEQKGGRKNNQDETGVSQGASISSVQSVAMSDISPRASTTLSSPAHGSGPTQFVDATPPAAREEKEDEPVTAVIVDGLPLSARRPDLDALLESAAPAIINVRLRRLERHGLLRVRVQFAEEDAAHAALRRDGAVWREYVVSVKPASVERWEATLPDTSSLDPLRSGGDRRSVASEAGAHEVSSGLPDLSPVSRGFWSAFGAARSVAERLEEGARQLGQRLERELHMSDAVERGRSRVREADRTYGVSAKVGEFAAASRDTAQSVDKQLGISDGVGSVVGGVGDAARIVAREVDENLRVSDKARDATNAAMNSPTVGHVARKVVGSIDGTTPPSKKNYKPRRLELDEQGEDHDASPFNETLDTAHRNASRSDAPVVIHDSDPQ